MKDNFESLNGKVAVVTGGTSGIGREIAKAFARNGMKVIFAGRNVERGNKIQEAITKDGGEAMFVPTDVRKEEDIKNLVKTAVEKYGKLHVMVNNAGVKNDFAPVHELPQEEFERIMETNVTATFQGIKYAVQAMLDTQSRGCSIINVASASGLRATESFSPYDTSKHAVIGMTKSAALDYAKHDITVNAICPGITDTEIFDGASDLVRQVCMNCIPIGRFGKPEEMAYAALFLASDMARFMTGSAVVVDGGYAGGDCNGSPWKTPDPRDLSDLQK